MEKGGKEGRGREEKEGKRRKKRMGVRKGREVWEKRKEGMSCTTYQNL